MNAVFVRIQFVIAVFGMVVQFASVAEAELLFGDPIRFPEPINSAAWESTAVLSPNGLELFFESNRSDWGTFAARRDTPSDPFGAPEKVSSLNHASISSDGLSLYAHAEGPFGKADIFKADRLGFDDPWDSVSLLSSSVNTGQAERWASISADGLELYFTRTVFWESTVADIWVARRTDPSAMFDPAVKLPANINKDYTDSPSLSPDGLALFFSSDGHGGYGYTDIFVSYREDKDSAWGDPVNLGPKINTAGAEWQPSMSPDGRTFLFTRSTDYESNDGDIWHAAIIPGLAGDVNFDGEVNGLDVDPFVEVLLNGTDDNATRITADMNSDGEVNGLDVDPFVSAVVGSGTQSVPEPSTLLLGLLALAVVGGWRKWGGCS